MVYDGVHSSCDGDVWMLRSASIHTFAALAPLICRPFSSLLHLTSSMQGILICFCGRTQRVKDDDATTPQVSEVGWWSRLKAWYILEVEQMPPIFKFGLLSKAICRELVCCDSYLSKHWCVGATLWPFFSNHSTHTHTHMYTHPSRPAGPVSQQFWQRHFGCTEIPLLQSLKSSGCGRPSVRGKFVSPPAGKASSG